MNPQQRLESAIDDFLAATALWNTQWFNKTKFHLFVHLLLHIECFGPAILFATETFESYNLVIRLRSINSNKHAPSLDIARSFSHLHAVRHLVSGGYVLHDTNGEPTTPRQAGPGVHSLLNDREFIEMMSMSRLFPQSRAGQFFRRHMEIHENSHGLSGFYRPLDPKDTYKDTTATALGRSGLDVGPLPATVIPCKSIVLKNEDHVSVGDYVVLNTSGGRTSLQVGRINEILVDPLLGQCDGALLTSCTIGDLVLPYRMPACQLQHKQVYARLAVRLFRARRHRD